MRVGLVGCVKTKLDRPAPARDLYVSPLFRGRRAHVEATCDRWFVLSASCGLVAPGEVLAPYDETLIGKTVAAKRAWADRVLVQLEGVVDVAACVVEIHAGSEYRDFGLVEGLRRSGASVVIPAAHLSQGEQLAYYAGTASSGRRAASGGRDGGSAPRPARWPSPPGGSAYAPLADHFRGLDSSVAQLSFTEIEQVLGRPLPASARRHRAWWANETSGSHSHARAWMGEGWLVDAVDPNAGTVRFRRGRR